MFTPQRYTDFNTNKKKVKKNKKILDKYKKRFTFAPSVHTNAFKKANSTMTAKQHLESARTSATWGVHAPALETWLAETRPGFMDQNFHSMSDLLLCFHWIHAPGGFDLWERIFAEQHEKDNREWWAYRLEKVL